MAFGVKKFQIFVALVFLLLDFFLIARFIYFLIWLEVERAWARARRPGPNFWLAVNKIQAWGSTSLIFSLNLIVLLVKKLKLKAGLRKIWENSSVLKARAQLGLEKNWTRSTSRLDQNFWFQQKNFNCHQDCFVLLKHIVCFEWLAQNHISPKIVG